MANDQANELACKVIDLAKADLLAQSPFLAPAIGRLQLQPMQLARELATNGSLLAYDAARLLQVFTAQGQPPVHDVLHAFAHCLFLHPYAGPSVDRDLWDIACDMAAERVVAEVLGPRPGQRGIAQMQAIAQVERQLGRRADAERIYRELRAGRMRDQLATWAPLMVSDSHELWYPAATSPGQGAGQGSSEGDAQADQRQAPGAHAGVAAAQQEQDVWRNVATNIAVELQTTSARQGQGLGGLIFDLQLARKPRANYADFLRRFARPGEALRINDDEFDQVFYTYGLKIYGNMPLVEPLEYREERRIREFVIVIDTSESVQGDAVRAFVDATYDILKSTESFFERIHVRILQCDAQVTSDTVVRSPAELAQWGRSLTVRGGGGTDFAPAFRHVDELVEQGAFFDLGGLVYFTDGLGSYPDWVPAYPAAFVFYDEDLERDDVPPWAYQVVLDDEALREAVSARQASGPRARTLARQV